jgi:hypothetical protein
LASDNTEIFNGFFSVIQANPSDTQGMVNQFYDVINYDFDNENCGDNLFINNGFDNADIIYLINDNQFSANGTNITSFPYFKNRYSDSVYYDLFQDGSGGVKLLDIDGNFLQNVEVLFTNTQLSLTYEYSIKITLPDNTEIFNGSFTVLQANPWDTQGNVTHFYDASNIDVDIFIDNEYFSSDAIFSIVEKRFTGNKTFINSFPYFQNLYTDPSAAFYSLTGSSGVKGGVGLFDVDNNDFEDVDVIFTITQISPPPINLWYSIKITLPNNTQIFNGFFSVLQTLAPYRARMVNHFYDLTNPGIDIYEINNVFDGNSLFFINDNQFSEDAIIITSFPYFKNRYSDSAFYNLYRYNGTDRVDVLTSNYEDIENINVIFTIKPILGPPWRPTVLLYSTKIKLAIGNTEIFNGYFTVFKAHPSDTQGVVTHFYDVLNGVVDIYTNNNFSSADSFYLINTNQFSYNGTNISSLPYLYDMCNNSVFYNLYQNGNRTKPDNKGRINLLDINGKVLQSTPVIFTTTFLSESYLLYSTQINLTNNTKIFNGVFNVQQTNPSDISGLVTNFYDLTDLSRGDIYTNNGYNGQDSVYFIDDDKFSSGGTNITSFPYFKNIYSDSKFYNLYNDGVNVLDTSGSVLDTVEVNFTNTFISEPPPPTTLWYYTKIKLMNNTEIFNGYFSVLQTNPFDILGFVTHFYDLTNYGVDIYINNGFDGADSIFLINSAKFSNGGTNITSFPFFNFFNTNSAYYKLYNTGTDKVNLLTIDGSVLQTGGLIFVNTRISGPPPPPPPPPPTILWYSIKINLLNNTEIFNGYFSVLQANPLDTSGVVTHFYDLTNYGVDIYTNNVQDSLFLINTNRFSSSGTVISSFPYFNKLYPNSEFYKLYRSGTDNVNILTISGSVLQTVEVIFTITSISGPPPPLPPVLKNSLFTNNATVYYKKNSLAPCGVGTVVNSRIKSKET